MLTATTHTHESITQLPTKSAEKARPATQPAEPEPTRSARREQLIAEAAYYRAKKRGFEAGQELEDWLTAEQEIDALIEAAV
jgi:hypothetical protein